MLGDCNVYIFMRVGRGWVGGLEEGEVVMIGWMAKVLSSDTDLLKGCACVGRS